MTLKDILDKTTAFFREKKIDSPRLDAELLLAHGLKLERIQLYLRFDQPMKEEELAVLRELVRRRAQGEPVAYILGYRDFYKYRFSVSSAVLIPRPETELLVEKALQWLQENFVREDGDKSAGLIDLGCGSGCIGLSMLKEWPSAKLIAVDISEAALEVAKRNAESLGVADRVRFLRGDAADATAILALYREFVGHESVDILVANPPYIDPQDQRVDEQVRKFEPATALFAEEKGLALLKKWSHAYQGALARPALVVMEMGLDQGQDMQTHFEKFQNFDEISVIKDLSGHDRFICGVKNG
ncbi:MAG: peptide chain release factor N(5)-glutamine methyltransferase [Bdellovibrio sp.]